MNGSNTQKNEKRRERNETGTDSCASRSRSRRLAASCLQLQDLLGDHRAAACSTERVLGRRGIPLEVTAARICRKAGASLATNVFARELNFKLPPQDGRRIQVVANSLPLWHKPSLQSTHSWPRLSATTLCLLIFAKKTLNKSKYGRKLLSHLRESCTHELVCRKIPASNSCLKLSLGPCRLVCLSSVA